jgi:glucose/arabinose dehydrogenase
VLLVVGSLPHGRVLLSIQLLSKFHQIVKLAGVHSKRKLGLFVSAAKIGIGSGWILPVLPHNQPKTTLPVCEEKTVMKQFWLLLSLLALLLIVVACQPAPAEPVVTPPVVAVATEVAVNNTPTAVPPTANPTNPPAPATATAVPTSTPAPTATPTAVVAQLINQINLRPIATGFRKPLGIDHAGDDRLFITQQHGVIALVQEGQTLPEPFLDIQARVNDSANEQGLLGLAFHPDYVNNGRFFLNYTRADDATVIAEFRVDPDNPNRALPESERILLVIPQPYRNHNGGQIKFGPDGFLYIGTGDGGSANDPPNNGQRTDTLLGKMLRLDVDNGDPYAIPASNPFVADDTVRNEIWALGLRNPWRFSFDRLTGDLYIADVGQNEWEEINFQPAASLGGENYGWRIFEATHCFMDDCATPGLTAPLFEYNHAGGHCSVTGGYVYRGAQFPELWGNYFLADYCSGQVWALLLDTGGAGEGGGNTAVVANVGFLVSTFGEDAQGELYIADQASGTIYQITP